MSSLKIARREVVAMTVGAGLAAAWPGSRAMAAEDSGTTAPVDTQLGKVRGKVEGGIAVFRGVPFGSDTAAHRFQPVRAAASWRGVRDCFEFGAQAPQILGGPGMPAPNTNTEVGRAVAAWMAGATFANNKLRQSEDCLFLNVHTPEASRHAKRPVMVWLHGGGYTTGSGGLALYDGSALSRRGDVVVVSVNHRLGALGYLYLGALHDDFADSGMVGQLDQVLALRWVRDNIAAFGGDPGNVTIFGESGGGSKVSVMLATPPARGLFHKAIIESGPGVKMIEKADAIEVAERTLAALGVAKGDFRKLLGMDAVSILNAMSGVSLPGARRAALGPVVDGRSLPAHPFHPTATEISRNIPLIIGTNKDEALLNLAFRPDYGQMTAAEARKRFDAQLGNKSAQVFEMYSKARPDDLPMYWYASMASDSAAWINSIVLAERKAAQNAAPVYMYRFDWVSPVAGGAFRTPHGFEVGMVFDNTQAPGQRDILGTGPETKQMAAVMSQAWINFARSGNPSQKGLAWDRYDASSRKTMIFDNQSKMVADPDRAKREFWAQQA